MVQFGDRQGYTGKYIDRVIARRGRKRRDFEELWVTEQHKPR
jgi:hypothetical protein